VAIKRVRTPNYSYDFDTVTGFFARWGKTLKDDPQYSPLGPEIVDCEISTVCRRGCPECYKGNSASGRNMTLAQFMELFAKLPENVGQIAFGIGDLDGNPDMLSIFRHARTNGCIPNVTTNGSGLDEGWARELAGVCGAVAVSRYVPKDTCYDAVKRLADAGLKQVNIHQLVSDSHWQSCMELLDDARTDPRLAKLNAIVFLSGKQKGRGTWLKPLSAEKYRELIQTAFEKGVRIGFDSCSAHKFLSAISGMSQEPMLRTFTEPCESGLFSAYIGVDGTCYPCSFSDDKEKGINLFKVDNFMEVWTGSTVESWRKRLLDNERRCPLYTI
jgi:MoaA/NifB/PqqE/SkfB family radical SAM enzyme